MDRSSQKKLPDCESLNRRDMQANRRFCPMIQKHLEYILIVESSGGAKK
jgi:hypothetical protein